MEGIILCKILSVLWGFFQLPFFASLATLLSCCFFNLREVRVSHYLHNNSTILMQKFKRAVMYHTCSNFIWFSGFFCFFYTTLSFCVFSTLFFLNEILFKKLRKLSGSIFFCIFSQTEKLGKNGRTHETYKTNDTNVIKLIKVTINSKQRTNRK